jgi:hypothetical protein
VSFYGVTLTDEDPSAAPPHKPQSIARSLWIIASTTIWLVLWFCGVVILTVVVSFAALILIMK